MRTKGAARSLAGAPQPRRRARGDHAEELIVKGSGVLLEVSAPTKPEAFDRFVARTREFAATWATWALTQRSITSTQKLIDLALTSQLIIRATPFTVDAVGAPIDLLRLLSLQPSSGKPIRLTSKEALQTLQRRLALRPDDDLELIIDARGVSEALPAPPPPVLERESILLLPGLPALHVGATLNDASEAPVDPDPPEEREVLIPESAEPLFEAIYADPDDDTLREVLADALEEAGHPRGRFIRLQLERAHSGKPPSREEERLLERHQASWLGDLTRLFHAVRWERGFPIEATIAEHLPGLLSRKELRTVERLRFDGSGRVASPALLERLTLATHVGRAAMPSFSTGRFPRLTALHCKTDGLIEFGVPSTELVELSEAKGLSAVRWFELDDGILEGEEGGRLTGGPGRFLDASDFEWLWPTALGRRIERFGTKVKLDVLGRWLERAHDLPVPVVMLRVCQYLDFESLWLRLERGSTVLRALWRAVPEGYDDHRPTTELLLRAIEESPYTRMSLEHPRPGIFERALSGPRLEVVAPGDIEWFRSLGAR
ncbi:MAG: TIGR02996 domain-containing protein [Archangium sp.]|nr:TIGR02996 domain-containing protein [Archangium sp.]